MLGTCTQTLPLTHRPTRAGRNVPFAAVSPAVLSKVIAVEDRDPFALGLDLLLILGLILELIIIT